MCGIAGILLNPEVSLPDLQDRLTAMAGVMYHRGPDDEGIYLSPDGRAGLANRRLAIRDLSAAGHMPMTNSTGNIWITYNGEIYNTAELRSELESFGYTFRSNSDTEVILHGYEAWREAVVKRLRGMFAFAILTLEPSTGRVQRLCLARDHIGIKPLYYAQTTTAFIFASELKTLLASGLVSREICPAGLVGYLLMGSVPNPLTIYRGITALEPAGLLQISPERPQTINPSIYWQLPTDTIEPSGETDTVGQVREMLAEAVRIRLVSDVPLGAFLSGGLDSSAVVVLMRQATNGPLRTCSMVFEEAEYSEAAYARTVAAVVGSEHYERVITADDLSREWDNILRAMDQPTVDGVNTYFVSQTARQAGLTVALSGLGGDELFGGYSKTFQGTPQILRFMTLAQKTPGGRSLARTLIHLLPNRERWRRVSDALRYPPSMAGAYLARRGLFASAEVKNLVKPDIWAAACRIFDPLQHITARAGNGLDSATLHPFEWVSRAELRTYTHHQLLRDTDIMSMVHSLEVRVPLLDVKLVETILRLPASVKVNGAACPKPLLAQAIADRLPLLVRERRQKQGFTFPFAPWLQGKLQNQAVQMLETVQSQVWLQPTAVRQVLQEYKTGKVHWSRPWALLALAVIND